MNNTTKKIILVDQDGVLANYHARFLHVWRAEHPEKVWIPLEDSLEHDVEKNYPPAYRDLIDEITVRKGFFGSLEPMPGAKDALEALLAMWHDVRICTAPKRDHTFCVPEKLAWIDQHLGRKWTERTIITRDKTLVQGDFLIDDKPRVAGVCKPSWEQIFYDQPYNRAWSNRRLTWVNYKEVIGL